MLWWMLAERKERRNGQVYRMCEGQKAIAEEKHHMSSFLYFLF